MNIKVTAFTVTQKLYNTLPDISRNYIFCKLIKKKYEGIQGIFGKGVRMYK